MPNSRPHFMAQRNVFGLVVSRPIYTQVYIYTTVFGNVAGKPRSGERAAGLGKLLGRKLGGQYKTRLRCINSTIHNYIYWQSQ